VPTLAELEVHGAAPGSVVLVDGIQAGTANAEGHATIANLKPGEHTVELRLEGAVPKHFRRIFQAGGTVTLAGPDVALQKAAVETKPVEEPAPAPPAETAPTEKPVEISGEQVRRGGGFVHYNVPHAAGRYSFEAHSRIGGFLKHDKLQWYAGYEDSANYILFSLDGKHASIRKVTDGKSQEINRIPFNANSEGWVQVDLTVNADQISARVRKPGETWNSIGTVTGSGRDFTKGRVGFYLPGNDEIAVANFRFNAK
jgi:hypothetical protein